jgi:cytochrome P450
MPIKFHDISGEFLVGKRFDNSMQSTFSRAYTESIAWLQIRVFFGIVGRNIPSLNFKRNCREIHAVIDRYLDDAIMKMAIGKHLSNKETHEPPANVVECLAASTTDRSTLRSQIIQCIMAMQETTSTLVTNTLFLLSRHPALWSSLKDEVQSVELHEDSVSKLKEMKLLQNIMRESE